MGMDIAFPTIGEPNGAARYSLRTATRVSGGTDAIVGAIQLQTAFSHLSYNGFAHHIMFGYQFGRNA